MPDIKIRIEKTQKKDTALGASSQTPSTDVKQVAATSIFAHQMMGVSKQIISFSASNVANFTGNYLEQDRVNQTLDVISDVSTVTMGFATGGPVGGAIAISGIVTKKIFQAISDARQNVLMERDRQYMLQRSGNAALNGSRGTEN